nr:hypothetical protein [uncultured Mucilaginibacter sp.]
MANFKSFYLLLIGLTISTAAWSQILKTETDATTGKEIRSAVVLFPNGMGHQLNFLSKGDEKLIEFVAPRSLEGYPERLLKTMAIKITLKNDSVCHFPLDVTKYTALDDHGFLRLSLVAVAQDKQLAFLLNSQVKTIALDFGDQKDLKIPGVSDNNRREIKRAVAYVMGSQK